MLILHYDLESNQTRACQMKKIAIIGGGVMGSYFGEACHRLGYESHLFSMKDVIVDDSKMGLLQQQNCRCP